MPTSPGSDEFATETEPDETVVGTDQARGADAAEVAELRAELARTQDRHRRALADLDNYRKRTERETERRVGEIRSAVMREWLDAVDSVERALQLEPDDPGLMAVLGQMEAILAREGVTRLDAVGTHFDPELHEAIAVQPSAEQPDYTVLEVGRSGFVRTDGTVLRPAQVVVSRRSAGAS